MTRLKISFLILLHMMVMTEKYVRGVPPSGDRGKTAMGCDPNDPSMTEREYNKRAYKLAVENKHEEAFDCYSYAIEKNPNIPKYYSNRAFCSFRLDRFDSVVEDCFTVLDMDPFDVKANFLLGVTYIEKEKFDDAVKYIQISYDSAKEQRLSFGDDIAQQLRIARRKKWRAREEERLAAENKLGLFPYLKQLIQEDKQREIDKVKEASGSDGTVNEEAQQKLIADIEQKFKEYVKDLTAILSRADERTKRRELPDYLCGRMNYKLLVDPVITPKGDTYERQDIRDHITRYGYFDPLNPEVSLRSDDLVSNLAIKEAAEAFARENDWLPEFEQFVSYNPDGMEE